MDKVTYNRRFEVASTGVCTAVSSKRKVRRRDWWRIFPNKRPTWLQRGMREIVRLKKYHTNPFV